MYRYCFILLLCLIVYLLQLPNVSFFDHITNDFDYYGGLGAIPPAETSGRTPDGG